jgi:hypothetical protein
MAQNGLVVDVQVGEEMVSFQTGPYGEVYPIPLVGGVHPDEALKMLADDSEAMGSPIDMPTRGKSLDGMYNLGLLYVHQQRLREALAGTLDLPEAQALRKVVIEQGMPMSLRPLTLEATEHQFAPVLRCLDGGRWRVGQEPQAVEFQEADPAAAMEKAQQVYVSWVEQDEDTWEEATKKAVERYPRSLFHDYWAHWISEHGEWERGGGFRLQLLGRHTTFMMHSPRGQRVFNMSRLRAVHTLDAIARYAGVEPSYPFPGVVYEWLNGEGIPRPDIQEDDTWRVGDDVQMRIVPEKMLFVLKVVEVDYVIQPENRRTELVMRRVENGKPDTSKMVAHTAVEPPFAEWMVGWDQCVLPMWFLWKARLLGS